MKVKARKGEADPLGWGWYVGPYDYLYQRREDASELTASEAAAVRDMLKSHGLEVEIVE